NSIAYDKYGRTHWRRIDNAEFIINGASVDIKGYHVYPSRERHLPQWLLDVEALVPYGQLRRANAPDIYLQAFLVAPQRNESSVHHFVHVFPKAWADGGLANRVVHVRSASTGEFRLFGEHLTDGERIDINENIQISRANEWIASSSSFVSLQHLSSPEQLRAPVDVRFEKSDRSHRI